jgi:hypothetical protein
MEEAKEVVWNGSWWVLLGILSSVGLGMLSPLPYHSLERLIGHALMAGAVRWQAPDSTRLCSTSGRSSPRPRSQLQSVIPPVSNSMGLTASYAPALHSTTMYVLYTHTHTSTMTSSSCHDALLQVTFWELLSKVQFEALMWGIGTAIGELPPYFVARAGARVQVVVCVGVAPTLIS